MNRYKIKSILIPGIDKPLYFRINSTDYETLTYTFYDKEFQLNELPFKPKWIIDAGANGGYTSVFFANAYQEARIIAIEPDELNVEIMKMNVKGYEQQIDIVESGLWNKDTYLKVKDAGLGEWGMIVEETTKSDPNSFKAVTVKSIMEKYNMDEIDILKINIEGAEKEVFSHGYEGWLDKVKILIIELHDRLKPGCSDAFFKAIESCDFEGFQRGWNHIYYKKGCL